MRSTRLSFRPPAPARGGARSRDAAAPSGAPAIAELLPDLPEPSWPGPRGNGNGDHDDDATYRVGQLSRMTEQLLGAQSQDDALAVVAAAGPALFPGWAGRLTLPGEPGTTLIFWPAPEPAEPPDAATPLTSLRVAVPPSAREPSARRLDLHLDHAGELSATRHSLAENMARALAAALDLALAKLSLQDQATRDELTGLHNRRRFDDALADEVARAQRDGSTLCLAMIDIDHFKRFNDRFGHAAGDAVLRTVGRAVRRSVRRSDIACRFGGEEIALLLPNSSADGALGHLESLSRRLAALAMRHEGRDLPPVTVSIGVARAQGEHIDARDLLRRADLALYAAKEQGRDRVVVDGND